MQAIKHKGILHNKTSKINALYNINCLLAVNFGWYKAIPCPKEMDAFYSLVILKDFDRNGAFGNDTQNGTYCQAQSGLGTWRIEKE